MRLKDILKFSVDNLSQRGLRSWLTIIGIVIGAGSVLSLLSLGEGLQKQMTEKFGELDSRLITINPGSKRVTGMGPGRFERRGSTETTENPNLTEKDVLALESVEGISHIDPIVSGRCDVKYTTESVTLSVEGVDPRAWKEMTTVELEKGRWLKSSDENAVIVGYGVAHDIFSKDLMLNTQLTVEGESFKIIGVLEESGGMGGSDNTVIMLTDSARKVVEDVNHDQYSSIELQVADSASVEKVVNATEERLMLTRHVTEQNKDFTVSSTQEIQETVSEMSTTLNLFLGGIAAISLLVGSVGIANTMFMSVMERTKQIGTLKALGSTDLEIMKMFILESSLIGLVGGVLGVFLGFIGTGLISILTSGMMPMGGGGATAVIKPQLVIFVLGFSILIGTLSGLLPARRAAKLEPVEALRYE